MRKLRAEALIQSLERREERALLCVFLIGALSAAYALQEWWLVAPTVAIAILYPILRPRKLRATNLAESGVLVAAALVAAPLAIAEQAPAPALALFLIAAQGTKLLAPKTERDKGTCCLVSIVLAGVAASEAVEPPIAALLLACLITTVIFANARSLRFHGLGRKPDPSPTGPRWVGKARTWRGARALAGVWIAATIGTLIFFFAFPRVGAKLLASQRTSSARLAGFTDKVGLSDIGRIKQNDGIAFRVEVESGTFDESTYWKGRALDIYDGKTWVASGWFGLTKHKLRLTGPLQFTDGRVRAPGGAKTEAITFFLEPLGTRCLFTTGTAQEFKFKSARPRWMSRDDLGSVLLRRPYTTPLAYTLHTYPADQGALVILGRARNFKLNQHCLEVPYVIDRDRLAAYTTRALRDQKVPPNAGPARIAEALSIHLRRNYDYTLTINSNPEKEPIAEFLYDRRTGHCELFASAHVMMLRARGIPARLVTGFRGGEYSTWSDSFTVRQRDAHAWVEALTETGWKTFDPTPAEAPAAPGTQIAEAMAALVNWMELRWFSTVIAFDAYDQRNFMVRVQEWIAIRLGLEEHAPTVGRTLGASVLGLVVFAALLAVWVLLRRPRVVTITPHRETNGAAPRPTDDDLAALLEALARRGFERDPCETPLELAERASQTLAVDGHLRRWVRSYYARRFGARDVPSEAPEVILRALEGP